MYGSRTPAWNCLQTQPIPSGYHGYYNIPPLEADHIDFHSHLEPRPHSPHRTTLASLSPRSANYESRALSPVLPYASTSAEVKQPHEVAFDTLLEIMEEHVRHWKMQSELQEQKRKVELLELQLEVERLKAELAESKAEREQLRKLVEGDETETCKTELTLLQREQDRLLEENKDLWSRVREQEATIQASLTKGEEVDIVDLKQQVKKCNQQLKILRGQVDDSLKMQLKFKEQTKKAERNELISLKTVSKLEKNNQVLRAEVHTLKAKLREMAQEEPEKSVPLLEGEYPMLEGAC